MRNLGRILVPVDFSLSSLGALSFATDLATDSGASLHVLHVICPSDSLDDAKVRMSEFLLGIANAPKAFETTIERGDPYARVVMAAANGEFGLIVMGTQGTSGLVHARMGSIAEQVAMRAPCPVLTVHAPAHASDIVPWFPRDAKSTFELSHRLPPRTRINLAVLGTLEMVCPNTDSAEVALACLSCPDLKMACVSMDAGCVESVCHKHPRGSA